MWMRMAKIILAMKWKETKRNGMEWKTNQWPTEQMQTSQTNHDYDDYD